MIRRILIVLLACVAAPLCAAHARAADSHADFAVRAGRIYTASADGPAVIHDGVLLVRDGKVAAIGADVEIPVGVRVVDLRHAMIMPGMVSACSNLSRPHRGDEAVSGAYHAADSFDRYADYRWLLASGVTTAHLSPGWHRLVSGRGAVVRLSGAPDDRVFDAKADLTITMGESVFNSPDLVDQLVPPSADNEITPALSQRPSSRLTQYSTLRDAINAARSGSQDFPALSAAWKDGATFRVQAQRRADLGMALRLFREAGRKGYVVGGVEAGSLADELRQAGIPLVYTVHASFNAPAGNLGSNPLATEPDIQELAKLSGVRLALATTPGASAGDLRLAAALALRAGYNEADVVAAITRTPAEILGVGDRVGSLDVGKDADFVVLSGAPLEAGSVVQHTFVGGREVYSIADWPEMPSATVVRAETVWMGPGEWLEDGEVLIVDGTIRDVGKRVARPGRVTVIDATDGGFVTPGLIDAFGRLGLEGDNSPIGPGDRLSNVVGAPTVADERVAQAGVTTVVTGPYRASGNGSPLAAINTGGSSRDARVVNDPAGLLFDLSNTDPALVERTLKPKIDAGRKYLAEWQKYEKALKEWEEKKAKGELKQEDTKAETVTEEVTEGAEDPLTGTWDITLSGGPIPEAQKGKVALRLNNDKTFEGRVIEPFVPVEVKLVGSLDDNKLRGEIEVDTGGLGFPEFEGEITEPDNATGAIRFQGVEANFEMVRTDKSAVEFKVTSRKRKVRGEDGRPEPPKFNPELEPMRAALEKKIPLVAIASNGAQMRSIREVVVDKNKLRLVLVDSSARAWTVSDELKDAGVGVVLPRSVGSFRDNMPYIPAADLSAQGLKVAFQSGTEDGARSLREVGLSAVARGMSPESALTAFTHHAAAMFGLDKHIGAIKPGLQGNVVIFSGHPFEPGSTVRSVVINGQEVSR